jgi:hypothetical protein
MNAFKIDDAAVMQPVAGRVRGTFRPPRPTSIRPRGHAERQAVRGARFGERFGDAMSLIATTTIRYMTTMGMARSHGTHEAHHRVGARKPIRQASDLELGSVTRRSALA